MSPLGFQEFYAAGPLHRGEAPPTFFPDFQNRAYRGKENGWSLLSNGYCSYICGFPLVPAIAPSRPSWSPNKGYNARFLQGIGLGFAYSTGLLVYYFQHPMGFCQAAGNSLFVLFWAFY
ncbi:unnamed protein product [Prunus armeniaca]